MGRATTARTAWMSRASIFAGRGGGGRLDGGGRRRGGAAEADLEDERGGGLGVAGFGGGTSGSYW